MQTEIIDATPVRISDMQDRADSAAARPTRAAAGSPVGCRAARVAVYARVSSQQQAKEGTIDSQVAALGERVAADGFTLDDERRYLDDGVSGSTLVRPALERLRDAAYAGEIDRLYVLAPDRLARRHAYQVVLLEEFARCAVEVIFLNHRATGDTPEEELLLQMQGMIAEYERAKILERTRRGKRAAATRGAVSVLTGAPFGYRYISKADGGGEARYQVVFEQARVVREMFEWIATERVSVNEVVRRLTRSGIVGARGGRRWSRTSVYKMLKNPAYCGRAAFGRTRRGAAKPRLRAARGQPETPRPYSAHRTRPDEQIVVPVPAIIEPELFEAVQRQLEENRRRSRSAPGNGSCYLLSGLAVCSCCNYAYAGKKIYPGQPRGATRHGAGRTPRHYYICTGTERARHGGEKLCSNKPVRMDRLDDAVWCDVCKLLADPERLRDEYTRRLGSPAPEAETLRSLESRVANCRHRVSRMIDAYEHSLLTRDEFESRVATARRQLTEAESELDAWQEQTRDQAELQNVIGAFEDFRRRIEQGLSNPDAATRQAIVRALVKRVEIDGEQVRVVYRVHPTVPSERQNKTPDDRSGVENQPAESGVTIKDPAATVASPAPWSFPYCSLRQRLRGADCQRALYAERTSINQNGNDRPTCPPQSTARHRSALTLQFKASQRSRRPVSREA